MLFAIKIDIILNLVNFKSGNMRFFLIITIVFFSVFNLGAQTNGYEIKIKIKGLANTTCYLANYYGKNQYYKDTAQVNSEGLCVFKKNKPLEGGIYSLAHNNKILFEFIAAEPVIHLETDTSNYSLNMKVIKSKENKLFFEHITYIAEMQQATQPLRKAYNEEKNEKKKKEIEKKINDLDAKVKSYRLQLIKENPTLFITSMFNAMKEPESPLYKEEKNDSIRKYKRYYYTKQHYFDDVNFKDDRLIRTPVYHNKIDKFFSSYVVQHPDSIIKEADKLIGKLTPNTELYKYTIHYITNTYEKSKIMGMDAVFVHMALKYYNRELAFWLDDKQIKKIRDRANTLKPLLIGEKAINISLLDTAKKNWRNFYSLNKDFTILLFWDPECGHCKKELPKIAKYFETVRDKGVEVFAVSSDHNKKWINFINEHKLKFINVAVPKEVYKDQELATEYVLKGYTDIKSLNYQNTYDIFTTPQIYLLDKNKKIIAKRLNADLLKKVLDNELKKRK